MRVNLQIFAALRDSSGSLTVSCQIVQNTYGLRGKAHQEEEN